MLARQQALDFGPGQHFQTLHGGHQCPVAVATKSSMGFKQHVYAHEDAPAMLQNLATGTDSTYLSQSGFAEAGGRRTVGAVRALTSFWVDADFYKLPELSGLTPDGLLERVLVKFKWLPLPTLLVESGRGCYFVWTFDKPLGVERLADWQRAEDALVTLLEPFGADAAAKDAARILRVAGSFHEVAGERVSARAVGSSVKFEAMAKIILAHAQPAAPSFKPDKGKPVLSPVDGGGQRKKRPGKGLNAYQLALDRMADFRTLAELRGAPLSDCRARLLYSYAVACCWYAGSVHTLNDELLDFAEMFFQNPERYGPRGVKSVIDRFADDGHGKIVRLGLTQNEGRYKATNKYLIRLLDITPDEQTHLRTIISAEEKRRRLTAKRRATGMMSREQYADRAAQRRSEALRMRSEGLSVAEIAKALGVATSSVYPLLHS